LKRYWSEATYEPPYSETRYSSNWNYVRELEIIQNYYRAQKREVPPAIHNMPPFEAQKL
jgi:hypothetical protein